MPRRIFAILIGISLGIDPQGLIQQARAQAPIPFQDNFDLPSLDGAHWNAVDPYWFEPRDGVLRVKYNTFDPSRPTQGPPDFTPITSTRESFGPGHEFTIRARVAAEGRADDGSAVPLPPGLNAAMFAYGNQGSVATQDEIDIELLTNRPDSVYLNTFADGQSGTFPNNRVVGNSFLMTDWHTYRFDYQANGLARWFIDGIDLSFDLPLGNGNFLTLPLQSRTMSKPVALSLTMWRPGTFFPSAYDPFIVDNYSATSAPENITWWMEVDWVDVRQAGDRTTPYPVSVGIPEVGSLRFITAAAVVAIVGACLGRHRVDR